MSDTYKVVKREVQAVVDGKTLDFKVQRYYATFCGKEPEADGVIADPFIEVWADGSLTLNYKDKRIFLYDDQWQGIIRAVEEAINDKKKKRDSERDKWLADTANATEFHGVKVDLTRTQVIEALKTCPIVVIERSDKYGQSTSPIIVFNGKQRSLGRTDLLDDVATGWVTKKTAEEWREHYLKVASKCMGGRLHEWEDGRLGFSVIDSVSDG